MHHLSLLIWRNIHHYVEEQEDDLIGWGLIVMFSCFE